MEPFSAFGPPTFGTQVLLFVTAVGILSLFILLAFKVVEYVIEKVCGNDDYDR